MVTFLAFFFFFFFFEIHFDFAFFARFGFISPTVTSSTIFTIVFIVVTGQPLVENVAQSHHQRLLALLTRKSPDDGIQFFRPAFQFYMSSNHSGFQTGIDRVGVFDAHSAEDFVDFAGSTDFFSLSSFFLPLPLPLSPSPPTIIRLTVFRGFFGLGGALGSLGVLGFLGFFAGAAVAATAATSEDEEEEEEAEASATAWATF
jgi:hypothetical protein